MRILKHLLIVGACLYVLLGLPFMLLYPGAGQKDPDAVTSASVILEKPSGEYIVFINKGRRKDEETLKTWEKFFNGQEISYVFEDIVCCVADGDAAAARMAASFQSRLPENQMKIRREDGTLMLSKAEHGIYDILIMSREAAELYNVDKLSKRKDVLVCHVAGDAG